MIRVVFEADENLAVNERSVPIAIFDDPINEAAEQAFIVQLKLISSTNPLSDLSERPASLCRIIDNDRKCMHAAYTQLVYLFLILNAFFVIMQLLELDLSCPVMNSWSQNLKNLLINSLYRNLAYSSMVLSIWLRRTM